MNACPTFIGNHWRLLSVIGLVTIVTGHFGRGADTTGFFFHSTGDAQRMFLVTGDDGAGLISPDGISWDAVTTAVATDCRSQCHGNGVSVRIDPKGRLWSSLDGTNWTARNPGVPFALHRGAFGNGHFVVIGNEGALITSTDGIHWIRRESGTDERLRGAAFGSGRFVVVGYAGLILVSRDGINWHRRRSGTDVRLQDAAFGNSVFVVVGWDGTILTSRDGFRWRPSSSGTAKRLTRVRFGPVPHPAITNHECRGATPLGFIFKREPAEIGLCDGARTTTNSRTKERTKHDTHHHTHESPWSKYAGARPATGSRARNAALRRGIDRIGRSRSGQSRARGAGCSGRR